MVLKLLLKEVGLVLAIGAVKELTAYLKSTLRGRKVIELTDPHVATAEKVDTEK